MTVLRQGMRVLDQPGAGSWDMKWGGMWVRVKIVVTVRIKACLRIRPGLMLGPEIHFGCKAEPGLMFSVRWIGLKPGISSWGLKTWTVWWSSTVIIVKIPSAHTTNSKNHQKMYSPYQHSLWKCFSYYKTTINVVLSLLCAFIYLANKKDQISLRVQTTVFFTSFSLLAFCAPRSNPSYQAYRDTYGFHLQSKYLKKIHLWKKS